MPAPPRLRGVDLARALAVLGMFAAHTALPGPALLDDPATWGGIVNGRSSILFATLAGVSLALVSGRTTPPEGADLARARRRVLVRAGCLFVLGGLVQFLITDVAVILEFYALLLAASVLVLGWRPRRLLLLAAGLALLTPPLRLLLAALQGTGHLGGGGVLGELTLTGTYPALVWSTFVVAGLGVGRLDLTALRVQRLLAASGLALVLLAHQGASWIAEQAGPPPGASSWEGDTYTGTWDDAGTISTLGPFVEEVAGEDVDLTGMSCQQEAGVWVTCSTGATLVAVAGAGDGSSYDESSDEDGYLEPTLGDLFDPAQLLSPDAHSSSTVEVVGSGGSALLVLGICLWVTDRLRRARWSLSPLVAVGSMPLTAYCGHLVALALVGAASSPEDLYEGSWPEFAVFALVTLVVCTLWARFVGKGPLERGVAAAVRRAEVSAAGRWPASSPGRGRGPGPGRAGGRPSARAGPGAPPGGEPRRPTGGSARP